MGTLEHFQAHGVHFELQAGDSIRAIGPLDDLLRVDIRTRKQFIVNELHWREFEVLLAIVGPAHNTPKHEYAVMRECAQADLANALICYRSMAALEALAALRKDKKAE